MDSNWQSFAAAVVVGITLFIFALRMYFNHKNSKKKCGGGCGCSRKWQEEDFKQRK